MADELLDVLHRLWSDDENYSYDAQLNPNTRAASRRLLSWLKTKSRTAA